MAKVALTQSTPKMTTALVPQNVNQRLAEMIYALERNGRHFKEKKPAKAPISYWTYAKWSAATATAVGAFIYYPRTVQNITSDVVEIGKVGVELVKEAPNVVNVVGTGIKAAKGIFYGVGIPLAWLRQGFGKGLGMEMGAEGVSESETVSLGLLFFVAASVMDKAGAILARGLSWTPSIVFRVISGNTLVRSVEVAQMGALAWTAVAIALPVDGLAEKVFNAGKESLKGVGNLFFNYASYGKEASISLGTKIWGASKGAFSSLGKGSDDLIEKGYSCPDQQSLNVSINPYICPDHKSLNGKTWIDSGQKLLYVGKGRMEHFAKWVFRTRREVLECVANGIRSVHQKLFS